ncbi:membrane-associated HD superfamily phosphohydrolase [Jeotgalibacillus terrae]|uniref:Uncharacterized protein n=2 Tax=Jeotgalibacillus terrae TaxID=587735 RepID=A0ABW5ZF46_9BACL|nr:hypothetical protein [Jeotgalibacillus terrae]MBM7580616.1 membrane-associated HD superfamily phosphohydrolase [Jeotgalibacillus terrae]
MGLLLAVTAVLMQMIYYSRKMPEIIQYWLPAWLVVCTVTETSKLILTATSITDAMLAVLFLVLLILIWPARSRLLQEAPWLTLLVILALQWLAVSLNGDLLTTGLIYSWLISAAVRLLTIRRTSR